MYISIIQYCFYICTLLSLSLATPTASTFQQIQARALPLGGACGPSPVDCGSGLCCLANQSCGKNEGGPVFCYDGAHVNENGYIQQSPKSYSGSALPLEATFSTSTIAVSLSTPTSQVLKPSSTAGKAASSTSSGSRTCLDGGLYALSLLPVLVIGVLI